MIGTIAMAVGSVVAKQAATIAFNRTVCWIKAKKGTLYIDYYNTKTNNGFQEFRVMKLS